MKITDFFGIIGLLVIFNIFSCCIFGYLPGTIFTSVLYYISYDFLKHLYLVLPKQKEETSPILKQEIKSNDREAYELMNDVLSTNMNFQDVQNRLNLFLDPQSLEYKQLYQLYGQVLQLKLNNYNSLQHLSQLIPQHVSANQNIEQVVGGVANRFNLDPNVCNQIANQMVKVFQGDQDQESLLKYISENTPYKENESNIKVSEILKQLVSFNESQSNHK